MHPKAKALIVGVVLNTNIQNELIASFINYEVEYT